MPLTYAVGDATRPRGPGPFLFPHVCNDRGGWGKGYVQAISRRWATPEIDYRRWFAGEHDQTFRLGAVRFVDADVQIVVANIIAQRGYKSADNHCPLDYAALDEGLRQTACWLVDRPSTVHLPRIGTGLGGAEWSRIEPLLQQHLGHVQVTIYDPF